MLPGFVDGYGRIAADEQRHIAYGTHFLRSAVQADPAMAEVVRGACIDLLPAVAESVSPPSEGAWDVLGVEDGALGAVRAQRAHPPAEDHRASIVSGRLMAHESCSSACTTRAARR